MKYFLFTIIFFMTACSYSPKYKVGDCYVIEDDYENWESPKPDFYHKVLLIGKKHYLLEILHVKDGHKWQHTSTFEFEVEDSISQKVDCPKELQ